MKKFKGVFLGLAILFTLVFCIWATVRIVAYVQFSLECEAYLKRAADANTVELAKGELEKAIEYAKQNNLTEGIVSIFLKNPKNDIGFWYKNLNSALDELKSLPENTTQLEKTNVLMKLRESLTDRAESGGTQVIYPDGIEIYPNNVIYFWWCILSCILFCVFWTLFLIAAGVEANLKINTITIEKKH